jgi:soluble lytic murein transglycosylase-like protein
MKSADRYDSLIQFYAEGAGLDWKLLKAQIRAESAFDPNAISSVGAEGLAQFMPATFREYAQKLHLQNPSAFNPEHVIACQAIYMKWLLGQFGGDPVHALAAYNFGIGRVKRGDPWPEETRQYVKKIMAEYQPQDIPTLV